MNNKSNRLFKILLIGGVGNRLFQITYANHLKDEGANINVIYIPRTIEQACGIFGWSYHQEWLDLRLLSSQLGLKYSRATVFDLLYLGLIYIFRKIRISKYPFDSSNVLRLNQKYIIGYFQSSNHLKPQNLNIVVQLIVHNLKIVPGKKTIIHVRGGDFKIDARMNSNELLEILKSTEEPKIITNDTEYVSKSIPHNLTNLIEHSTSDLDDFIQLASAKVLYPSNSTFSFWASKIAQYLGSKVNYKKNTSSFWDLM